MALTTNYSWYLPTVYGDTDAWGTQLNTTLQAIDTQVKATDTIAQAALPKAGGTMAGAIVMGANKVTGVGAGTASTDAVNLSQIQAAVSNHSTAVAGTVDAITATMSPTLTAYITNAVYRIRSGGLNTVAAPTINIDGLGIKTIKKGASVALVGGDTGAVGHELYLTYNGTDMLILNPIAASLAVNTFNGQQTYNAPTAFNEAPLVVTAGVTAWDMSTQGPDAAIVWATANNLTITNPTAFPSNYSRGTIRISNGTGAARTISWGAAFITLGVGAVLPSTIASGDTKIIRYWTLASNVYIVASDTMVAAAPPIVTVRQTVATGPVDTAGLPTFLPATSASLSITSQNLTSTAPLVSTAAQGATASGQINVTNVATANITWGPVTASNTNYLYVNTSTGAAGFTILTPIYQYGGTPAVTSGQFTFNYSEMQGYMGNGTTAPATPLVFVGEVVAGAATITSTIAYAYNGFYDSGYTATLPGAGIAVNKNSNVGNSECTVSVLIQCTTADLGYSIGDTILLLTVAGQGSTQNGNTMYTSRNSAGFVTNGTGPICVGAKTTGVNSSLTVASWKYKVISKRLW